MPPIFLMASGGITQKKKKKKGVSLLVVRVPYEVFVKLKDHASSSSENYHELR